MSLVNTFFSEIGLFFSRDVNLFVVLRQPVRQENIEVLFGGF